MGPEGISFVPRALQSGTNRLVGIYLVSHPRRRALVGLAGMHLKDFENDLEQFGATSGRLPVCAAAAPLRSNAQFVPRLIFQCYLSMLAK